ncbi:hypothetical protein [Faecalibacter bovis]|uniref:Uncharacterized protein n=1 Tax=Faecalibacter bovis TaxID=2898187 RepID=A0ABX7XB98_9FLAO|nr:hypothetical protein [Faecalibacter bovis]QTV05176.1 hypothetical protein J9309_10330 [Faecalibacter bovis]
MSSYIYIKNYFLEELQNLVQEYFNNNYTEESTLEVNILMKNSRTYFVQFNEELAIEELLDWINNINLNKPSTERKTIIEGYQTINSVDYKFYFINDDIFAINSKNETYKIEDLEELVPITISNSLFSKTEIPTKNIHSMATIKFFVPKKKWWKIW